MRSPIQSDRPSCSVLRLQLLSLQFSFGLQLRSPLHSSTNSPFGISSLTSPARSPTKLHSSPLRAIGTPHRTPVSPIRRPSSPPLSSPIRSADASAPPAPQRIPQTRASRVEECLGNVIGGTLLLSPPPHLSPKSLSTQLHVCLKSAERSKWNEQSQTVVLRYIRLWCTRLFAAGSITVLPCLVWSCADMCVLCYGHRRGREPHISQPPHHSAHM